MTVIPAIPVPTAIEQLTALPSVSKPLVPAGPCQHSSFTPSLWSLAKDPAPLTCPLLHSGDMLSWCEQRCPFSAKQFKEEGITVSLVWLLASVTITLSKQKGNVLVYKGPLMMKADSSQLECKAILVPVATAITTS